MQGTRRTTSGFGGCLGHAGDTTLCSALSVDWAGSYAAVPIGLLSPGTHVDGDLCPCFRRSHGASLLALGLCALRPAAPVRRQECIYAYIVLFLHR